MLDLGSRACVWLPLHNPENLLVASLLQPPLHDVRQPASCWLHFAGTQPTGPRNSKPLLPIVYPKIKA